MTENTQILLAPHECQECRRPWLDGSERWRMYVLVGEGTETLLYCPACAGREFDPD